MANKTTNTAPPAAPEPSVDNGPVEIDTLREKHEVDRATFAGVCAAKGWAAGKVVAEKDFLAAVEAFKTSPMGGQKEEEKKEEKK